MGESEDDCRNPNFEYRWKLTREFHRYTIRIHLRDKNEQADVIPYTAYYVDSDGRRQSETGKMRIPSGISNFEAGNDGGTERPYLEYVDVGIH
jgi:hypothetical protein